MKNINLTIFNKKWIQALMILILVIIYVLSVAKLYTKPSIENKSSLGAFTNQLDERIPKFMKDYGIPGVSIALVQDGQLAWSKGYGYANLETERRMTRDTYCRTQSISKSITAWGVMKLVEDGKINLDHPVDQYIKSWKFPETKFSEEKITVRQLLTHTSGLPLGTVGPPASYSPDEEIPSLKENLTKEAILSQEPGQSFIYSNVGFNLLELLIEEVTEQDFAEYIKKEIFIPLGMNHSTFTWSEDLNPAVPMGSNLKGDSVPIFVYPEKASGGLLASAEDIATFLAAEMTDFRQTEHDVLQVENIKQLYTPMTSRPGIYGLVFDSYGYGHFIENLSKEKLAISHGGQGYGIMTHFHAVPETGDGVVILTNSQRSWPFISYLLTDWAKWCGFSSVGMSKIILGQKVMWLLIGFLFSLFLWQVWQLVYGLISGKRRFAPLSKAHRLLRSIQTGISIILLVVLLRAIGQDYSFMSSVFPVASSWLRLSAFLLASGLLVMALFPRDEKMVDSC